MNPGFLAHSYEFTQPTKYDGKGELRFAVIGCLVWFIAIIVRLSFSSESWTLTERVVEATSFVLFAGIPVFFGATPPGSRFIRKVLLKQAGLWFQLGTCFLLAGYIILVKQLDLSPDQFTWMNRLNNLILVDQFWLNTLFLLIGVFVILRIPFLLLQFRDCFAVPRRGNHTFPLDRSSGFISLLRQNRELIVLLTVNSIYVSLVNTYLSPANSRSETSGYYIGLSYWLISIVMQLPIVKRTSPNRMMVFDFLLTATCIGSLFWFSKPFFSFGVFIGIDLFILAVIYGTGLGREHFGYSFQARRQDVWYLLKLIAVAFVSLVPIAYLMRFTSSIPFEISVDTAVGQILFLLSYGVLFSFRVGVFEEVLFRSGLMVFIRDQLQEHYQKRMTRKTLLFVSVIVCSIIFGLCHIGNTPRSNSLLSPSEYKVIYATLATIASLFYSIAFGETNRLWCSILIHGTVDTTAVLLLGASLTVPF